MTETIAEINSAVNGFIWGLPAMICIIGVGILLTVKTRCIQVRKFGEAMKDTIGKIFDKNGFETGITCATCKRCFSAKRGDKIAVYSH